MPVRMNAPCYPIYIFLPVHSIGARLLGRFSVSQKRRHNGVLMAVGPQRRLPSIIDIQPRGPQYGQHLVWGVPIDGRHIIWPQLHRG
jgi:hypothetical protein